MPNVHPSTPPFPVDTYLASDHFSGSQSSNVMPDRSEVAMYNAIRHKLVETSCDARLHDATLSGNLRVVPLVTYSSLMRFAFATNFSGSNDKHRSLKSVPSAFPADVRGLRAVKPSTRESNDSMMQRFDTRCAGCRRFSLLSLWEEEPIEHVDRRRWSISSYCSGIEPPLAFTEPGEIHSSELLGGTGEGEAA